MTELRNPESTKSEMADLDDARLLGFEWLEPEPEAGARTEQAIGVAFNRRGLAGEGPGPKFAVRRLNDRAGMAVQPPSVSSVVSEREPR